MSEFEWWKGGPIASSSVLTVGALQEAWNKCNEEEYASRVFYLHSKAVHYYRCMLAKAYWKREYREFRIFKKACEMGWLNGRY